MTRLGAVCLAVLIGLVTTAAAWAQPARPGGPPTVRPAPVRVAPPPVATPPPVRITPQMPRVTIPEVRPDNVLTPDPIGLRAFVALVPTTPQAASLIAVLRQRGLEGALSTLPYLGGALVSFILPDDSNQGALLGDLPDLFPGLVIAPNARLSPAEADDASDPRAYARHMVGWAGRDAACTSPTRLGMVDSGVDLDHPAFAGHEIMQKWLVEPSNDPSLLGHGTAIAALLVGQAPDLAIEGMAPGAVLYSAGIFSQESDGGLSASVEDTLLAIDWLGSEQVDVVNLSIAGPDNAVLRRGISLAGENGLAMVAAAGNTGRGGPAAFPAASPEVLAVTAPDQRLRAYRHATHGAYIDVAAPGVDVWTAAPGAGGTFQSGTSVATPFVSVMIGALRTAQPDAAPEALYATLRSAADDLGETGHDPVFGWGLAHLPASAHCPA